MNVTFVEDPQHQVHRQQRTEDHPRLTLLRRGEGIGGPGHFGNDVGRQPDGGNRPLYRHGGLVEAGPFGQIEGNVFSRELTVMRYPVVGQTALVMGDARQRYALPVCGNHLDLFQRHRVLGVFWIDLHHHLVLVEAVIDGRYLALAVSVVEHRRDHVHIDTQPLGRVTVDHQGHLLCSAPFPCVDGGQLGYRLERCDDLRVPQTQAAQVSALHDVLILRTGLLATAAQLQVLIRCQEQPAARHMRHVLAQALDHFLGRQLALGNRLEAHDHESVIGATAATDKTGNAFHRRVSENRQAEGLHFRLHDRKRKAIVTAHETHQLPGVLLRQKGLGYHHIQRDIDHHGDQQAEQRQPSMPHHPAQRAVVACHHSIVDPLAPALKGVFPMGFAWLQPARAQHWRQGQGHDQRDDDRH